MTKPRSSHRDELVVLALFGGGLIGILGGIIAGLFLSDGTVSLPNWAENVLVALVTGALLKMGDVLSALVALSTGRQVEGMSKALAEASPAHAVPADAADAARQTADAADQQAEAIERRAEPPEGEAP